MEFDLIRRYFQAPFSCLWQQHSQRWPAGANNDCSALQLHPNERLWTSTDTLVEGVHWFSGHCAYDVGWKALACNVSDLMACGAEPLGFVLALTLPSVLDDQLQTVFLQEFSAGLLACAQQYQCPLVGGDTTSGRTMQLGVVINITVFGVAPKAHCGFARDRAVVGDAVWVSGLPGLARLGLLCEYAWRGVLPDGLAQHADFLQALPAVVRQDALSALHQPRPPVALGLGLRGVANAALDLSDGLAGDLDHIARASQAHVVVQSADVLGLWRAAYPQWFESLEVNARNILLECSLVGGDDYQLCWTQPAYATYEPLPGVLVSCIGDIQALGGNKNYGVWLNNSEGVESAGGVNHPRSLSRMPYASYQHCV